MAWPARAGEGRPRAGGPACTRPDRVRADRPTLISGPHSRVWVGGQRPRKGGSSDRAADARGRGRMVANNRQTAVGFGDSRFCWRSIPLHRAHERPMSRCGGRWRRRGVCGWETRVQRGCGGTNLEGACSACSEVQVQRRGRRLSRMPSTHAEYSSAGGARRMPVHARADKRAARAHCVRRRASNHAGLTSSWQHLGS